VSVGEEVTGFAAIDDVVLLEGLEVVADAVLLKGLAGGAKDFAEVEEVVWNGEGLVELGEGVVGAAGFAVVG
jgi:hypothetical protein